VDYTANTAGLVLHHLRLLRVTKLYAMFRMSRRRRFSPSLLVVQLRVVPVFRMIFYLVAVIHMYTVIWLALTPTSDYLEGIYLVLYTITTVGLGDIPIKTSAQRVYNCVMFVSGAIVNGFVISKLSQILQKSSVQQEKNDKMTEMVSLLKTFHIPKGLQEEILAFQYNQLENDLSAGFREAVESLPTDMQEQLSMYAKVQYVSKLPMVRDASDECKMALARALTQVVFSPREFIICAGERNPREMYFLTHGFADVLSPNGAFIITLKRGAFFGEYALLDNGKPRSASIKALTYCDTFVLDREPFLDIMSRYPAFQQKVTKLMKERHVPAASDKDQSFNLPILYSEPRSLNRNRLPAICLPKDAPQVKPEPQKSVHSLPKKAPRSPLFSLPLQSFDVPEAKDVVIPAPLSDDAVLALLRKVVPGAFASECSDTVRIAEILRFVDVAALSREGMRQRRRSDATEQQNPLNVPGLAHPGPQLN